MVNRSTNVALPEELIKEIDKVVKESGLGYTSRGEIVKEAVRKFLKELASKNFILKEDIGHQNVNYKIQEKGAILLKHLQQIQELIK